MRCRVLVKRVGLTNHLSKKGNRPVVTVRDLALAHSGHLEPLFNHARSHSSASVISAPRRILCCEIVSFVSLKTRSTSVFIAGIESRSKAICCAMGVLVCSFHQLNSLPGSIWVCLSIKGSISTRLQYCYARHLRDSWPRSSSLTSNHPHMLCSCLTIFFIVQLLHGLPHRRKVLPERSFPLILEIS